jgi:hypothetical protein
MYIAQRMLPKSEREILRGILPQNDSFLWTFLYAKELSSRVQSRDLDLGNTPLQI